MSDPTNQGGEWQHVPSSTPGSDPVSGYPPATPGYPPQQPGYPPQQAGYPPQAAATSEGLSPTAAAAISYITIIPAIIFLVMDPYKRIPLVRFHSLQCLFFNAAVFVFYFVFAIVWGIISHIIPLLAFVGLLIWPLLGLLFLGVWIFLVFKASKGEWFKLPLIGDIAMKQANAMGV